MAADKKVVVITGGNTGIGFACVKALLSNNQDIHICLACRNLTKAEDARKCLLGKFPVDCVSIVALDVSSLTSVYEAAQQLKHRDSTCEWSQLEPILAGNFLTATVDHIPKLSNCIDMFATGDGLLHQVDRETSDGLKEVFATNLFGHFVLIRELEDLLGGERGPSQIIWTSSSNASAKAFDVRDIQHRHGEEPYGSSKYACDMLSAVLNEKYQSRAIHSHTTCPGLVITNLTFGILPAWFWTIFLPLLWLLRLFVPSVTVTPENGATALVWLSRVEPGSLSPVDKYHSRVSALGKPYVHKQKMSVDLVKADELYKELDELQEQLRKK